MAAVLGVSLRTVEVWVRKRKVRAFRTLGGHIRIPKEEVARILKEHGVVTSDGEAYQLIQEIVGGRRGGVAPEGES